MRHAYVYYRVVPAQAALAAERVDGLLKALAVHCSRPPRRLVRCDDPATWMETYEGIDDFPVFAKALHAATDRLGCHDFIEGKRHLECFSSPAAVAD